MIKLNSFLPKVSVIIPTYNCAKYLLIAVNSVLNQTFHDFEIIIVDDGSTDNTKEILKNYIKEYQNKIRYFYQENNGPGAARNKGIKEAKGEYVAFLDSDDKLVENSLLLRKNFLDSYPEIGLVFTDYFVITVKDGPISSLLEKKYFLKFFESAIYFRKDNNIIFNDIFFTKFFQFSPLPIWTGTVMIRKKHNQ